MSLYLYKYSLFMNFRVALLIETSNAYAREILQGINGFVKDNNPWVIYMDEFSRGDFKPDWIRKWKGDGIIARIENKEMASIIKDANLPTVDVSAARLIKEIPWIETEDKEISMLAANHLIECGFKNFAFCGAPYNWSKWRFAHFIQYMKEKGFPVFSYEFPKQEKYKRWHADIEKLALWLNSLPKPVGIFAAYDTRGRQIIEICQMYNIRVPEDVGVIGVDNDALLCGLSRPPLSSIAPDAFYTGYHAAAMLNKLLNGEVLPQTEIRVKPLGVVSRQSTSLVAVEDPLISKAISFIHENALKNGFTVNEIVHHISLSRSAFEKRFKKYTGHTPYEEINKVKIYKVRELLINSSLSLVEISDKVGIQHQSYLGYIFKKHIGMTPSKYRKQHKKPNV